MSRLGIVAALSGEAQSLTRQRITTGTIVQLSGNSSLALSGMGAARAQAAGQMLLQQGATALVSWGSAAALANHIEPGSLILPETIIAANGVRFTADADWHTRLYSRLHTHFTTYTQALVESPDVVCSVVAKRLLCERTSAVAVDMESAALAALAQEAKVPFMAIRVVADTAEMAVPPRLVEIMNSDVRFQQLRLAGAVMLHPADWPTIARLAWGFRAAQTTLAGVAKYAGDTLLAASV